ncbi:MAG: nicotinamide-nucleotide adenylyltransferase [Burkholderiales bacterium]|nr:MAG: nicotinamide-nucleotide adenylyltransferase [Burkholderiales bacterium]TAG79480.1 MAG: nicotinamide-nucleotide adenylyltransferase [Betaproteobacteria bacterium]
MSAPKLIAIVGAESTGKTSLARALAQEFHSPWVPEYLRRFCDERGRTPYVHEQALILETQRIHEDVALQEAAATYAPLVICDTAPLMTAVYSEFIFGDVALYRRAIECHHRYAHTLLLCNDLLWLEDGFQRDGPQVRARIFDLIEANLESAGLSYSVIDGDGHTRTLNAMHVIDNLLKR